VIALIDADIVSFSCAIYNEEWGWNACRDDIDALMKRILETTGATSFEAYITGDSNFRYDVEPNYKANRRGKPDPIYRADANTYLVTEYGAKVSEGCEADDLIGIGATRYGTESIICTIDKDLNQVPGIHYNWRKDSFNDISTIDALRSFYRQFLIGDASDNIIGISGIGEVKSARIINSLEDEFDMFQAVRSLYNDDSRFIKNGNLLWLWRNEGERWEHVVDQKGFMNDTSRELLDAGNGSEH